jgi:hypothetical protein
VALNFPNSPGIGSVFVDTNSGFSYKWDGTVWSGFVGQQPSEIKVLTDISSSFNGILTTFALAHDGSAVHPVNSAQLRVVLGGAVQAAGSDYTISTSNIVFTTAPIAALDCAITLLGTALALNVLADESVTPGKLSTGGPKWNTSGDVYISGIATANNGLVVGVGLTLGDNVKLNLGTGSDLQIVHDGSNSIIDDAGTGSLVLRSDTEIKFLKRTGDENILVGTPDGSVGLFYDNTKRFETTTGGALVYGTVGAGQTALVVEGDGKFTGVVTATSFSGNLTGNLTGNASGTAGGLTGTPDIAVRNITGVAATFTGNVSVGGTLTYEDVTNVDSVGVITARTGIDVLAGGINAVGVVTATSFSGDGSNLSGIPDPNKSAGVSVASTSLDSSGDIVVILDVDSTQSFTYTVPSNNQVGLVSFTNIPVSSGTPSVTTISLKITQNAGGDANVFSTYQIGQLCTIVPSGGSEITPIRVSSDGTLTLSTFANSENAFRYKVFYDGGSTSSASSYDIIGEAVTNKLGVGLTDVSVYGMGRKVVTFSDTVGFIAVSDTSSLVNAGFTSDGKTGGIWSSSLLYTVKYPSGEVIDTQIPTSPTGQVYGGQIHPSGESFVTSTNNQPYVKAWPLTNGVFGSKYSNPSTLPSAEGRHAKFSPDGNHVAVISTNSPRLQAYPWSNSTGFGAKYSNPSTLSGSAFGCAWHPDGNAIAFLTNSSPYVQAFPFTGSGFGTRYSNPSIAIAGVSQIASPESVAFSPDGRDIAIAHGNDPYISVYPWTSGSGFGNKYDDGADAVGQGTFVSWSVSSGAIFIGQSNTLGIAAKFTHHDSGGSNGGFGSTFSIPITISTSNNFNGVFPVPTTSR